MKKSEIVLLVNIACLCGILSTDSINFKLGLFSIQLITLWLQFKFVKQEQGDL